MSGEENWYESALKDAATELARAQGLYRPFVSEADAMAIIQEEVDELRALVWEKQSKHQELRPVMRKEAVQIAAMCMRYLHDIERVRHPEAIAKALLVYPNTNGNGEEWLECRIETVHAGYGFIHAMAHIAWCNFGGYGEVDRQDIERLLVGTVTFIAFLDGSTA